MSEDDKPEEKKYPAPVLNMTYEDAAGRKLRVTRIDVRDPQERQIQGDIVYASPPRKKDPDKEYSTAPPTTYACSLGIFNRIWQDKEPETGGEYGNLVR